MLLRELVMIAVLVALAGPAAAMGPNRSTPIDRAALDAAPRSPEDIEPRPGPATGTAPVLTVVEAGTSAPAEFLWRARPVVVFADTPQDPAFVTQLRLLEGWAAQLMARDVVVVTDTDPAAAGPWRQALRPEGFSLVLLDKDGQVKQRKPAPWDGREISRAIDKLPLRLQEIGRAGGMTGR